MIGSNSYKHLVSSLLSLLKHKRCALRFGVLTSQVGIDLTGCYVSVERVFSTMSLLRNKLRNSMSDDLLNYCLVTFIERALFLEGSQDDIVGVHGNAKA
jgi:hypothetical protein